MEELLDKLKQRLPSMPQMLFIAAVLLLLLSITLALGANRNRAEPEVEPSAGQESPTAAPTPDSPEKPALLVTAEQMAKLSYTDSVLGELSWNLSEESLRELNQTLIRYGILDSEEICHFLAQATVETGAGRALTEEGDEDYFRKRGYTTGTRGAGYLHLTHDYGQMAFATWMLKNNVPALANIPYVSPVNNGAEDIAAAYYAALQAAANLGLNISRYSRIVYDPNSTLTTGADYIAAQFAWESAGYYWTVTGIGQALTEGNADAASLLVGGSNWQSRREAYAAFRSVLTGTAE